jgi:Zn-dependent protease with chaperone function
MTHPADQPNFLKGTNIARRLAPLALAAAMMAPAWALSQAPAGPPPPPPSAPSDQTPANTPPPAQSPAPAKTPAPAQTPAAAQTKPVDVAPVPQKDNPDVKAGSKDDVDAIGNRKVGNGVNFYSLEREIALGKSLAQEVEHSAKMVDDPVVTEYVNRVGQNLVRNSDAKVPFTIKVIDTDVVNAMALPGGFFYVNSGLILRADSEAELAGVMAHEIAHVAARHGTKDATKGELVNLASIPLIMLGPGGWAGYGLYQGLNFAIPLSFLQFSRQHEAEADFLGLQYMYKSGYDPNAFITFFEKIEADEKKQPGTIPKLFSTHPPTPDRVKNIQNEIGNVLPARDQYIVTTSEFDVVKARLQGIENRDKLQSGKQEKGRPTLRTRTETNKPGDQTSAGGTGTGTSTSSGGDPTDDPDRPTLHKRTDDSTDPQ